MMDASNLWTFRVIIIIGVLFIDSNHHVAVGVVCPGVVRACLMLFARSVLDGISFDSDFACA